MLDVAVESGGAVARGEAGHHDGDGNTIGIAQRRPGIAAADIEQLDQAI